MITYNWLDNTLDPWSYLTWNNISIITDGHYVLQTQAIINNSEGRAKTPCTYNTGSWSVRFRATGGYSQFIQFAPIVTNLSTLTGYNIKWNSDNTLKLYKDDGGTQLGSTVTVTFDTNWHIIDFIRNSNGDISVKWDGTTIITGNDTTYTTNTYMLLRNWSGAGTNNVEWDYIDYTPIYLTDSLQCKSNIHWGSSLQCKTMILPPITSSLKCVTEIYTSQLLRTSFDGTVLDEHLTLAPPFWGEASNCSLDAVNHRLTTENVYIEDLDVITKGFNLSFDIVDSEPDTLEIIFNPIHQHYDNVDPILWHLKIDKINNLISLIKSYETYSFNPVHIEELIKEVPYIGSYEGHYDLNVLEDGLLNFSLNNNHIITDFQIPYAMESPELQIINTPEINLDNLIVTYATQTSKLSCKSLIRNTHVISSLPCKTNIGNSVILTLTLQGSIFTDNPVQPPILPPIFPIDPNNLQPIPPQLDDKLIFMSINEMVFPDMIDFSVETRGNDSNTTFTINYESPDDLLLFTGQVVSLMELGGNPNGFFQGAIQKIDETKNSNERTYTITGRNTGNNMVTQGFHIDAMVNDPTSFTSEQWVNMIMFGSDVRLGACVDYHVDEIWNANQLYNGFAGNWTTKAAALTELMSLISKLRNQNISWFLDSQGLLRIFYTDQLSRDVAIDIALNDPRVENYIVTEDAQSILNDQRGKGGQNSEFKAELQDIESKNGWIDEENGLTWPGYGLQPGTIIQDSAVTTQGQLDDECQHLIDMDSKPIFTLQMVLSKFPGCEIGQPLVVNDHYKLKGHVTVITSIVLTGNPVERYTTLTTTNDKKILGPLNDYESVVASVKHTIHKTAPFYGIVMDIGDGHANIKPVDNIANVNAKDLSKQE